MSRLAIHVLTFEGCPNADSAWAAAREAIAECDTSVELIGVDLMDPTIPAQYRGYPSPTILVGRKVVSPAELAPEGAACRASGAPSAREVRAAVLAALAPGSE
ncbi:MAG TPA: hypothetical protein VK837_04050 [Longimicrobiales bacterium]|nr:hypothetical protein [Longimicrobiales bacterium]